MKNSLMSGVQLLLMAGKLNNFSGKVEQAEKIFLLLIIDEFLNF